MTPKTLFSKVYRIAPADVQAFMDANKPLIIMGLTQVIDRHRGGSTPKAEAHPKRTRGKNPNYMTTAPLFDSEGREYQVQYEVLPAGLNGQGPVRPSHIPGTFAETPGYTPEFQARDLSSFGESEKIRDISLKLDPTRLLWASLDLTIGAPVVWPDGKGRYDVLGGNGRTIAILMAPAPLYAAYVKEAKRLWPGLWPAKTPKGARNVLVRVARRKDGSPLSMEEAVQLGAASQSSTSAAETPFGLALSRVRSLGLQSLRGIPPLHWIQDIDVERWKAFNASDENSAFVDAVMSKLSDENRKVIQNDDKLAAALIQSVLVGQLPKPILRAGFGDNYVEQAVIGALPGMLTIEAGIQAGNIQPGWTLIKRLPTAIRVYEMLRRKRIPVFSKKRESAMGVLTREANQPTLGSEFAGFFDGMSLAGYFLAIALYKASRRTSPKMAINEILQDYFEQATGVATNAKQGDMMATAAAAPTLGGMFEAAPTPIDPAAVLATALELSVPMRLPAGMKKNPGRRGNPVKARRSSRKGGAWQSEPPRYTPSKKAHMQAPATRAAQRLVAKVLAGKGQRLGAGNFGVAYQVDGHLVKLGSKESIHSRRGFAKKRTKAQVRHDMMHEAGVANELAAMGFSIIPRTVYAEHKGMPALVREYGELTHVSHAEYDQLARALYAVAEAGWRPQDELLVARRPDGSLFIADVGIWAAPEGGTPLHLDHTQRGIDELLSGLAEKQPWMPAGERRMPHALSMASALERTEEGLGYDAEDGMEMGKMAAFHTKHVQRSLDRRKAAGFPPTEITGKYTSQYLTNPGRDPHSEKHPYRAMLNQLDASGPVWVVYPFTSLAREMHASKLITVVRKNKEAALIKLSRKGAKRLKEWREAEHAHYAMKQGGLW